MNWFCISDFPPNPVSPTTAKRATLSSVSQELDCFIKNVCSYTKSFFPSAYQASWSPTNQTSVNGFSCNRHARRSREAKAHDWWGLSPFLGLKICSCDKISKDKGLSQSQQLPEVKTCILVTILRKTKWLEHKGYLVCAPKAGDTQFDGSLVTF